MNAKLLRWPLTGVDEGAPFSTERSETVNLIEIPERESPKLALRRPNRTLLRPAQSAVAERALAPGEIALVSEPAPEKGSPGTGHSPENG
jgi:hypothetical protein